MSGDYNGTSSNGGSGREGGGAGNGGGGNVGRGDEVGSSSREGDEEGRVERENGGSSGGRSNTRNVTVAIQYSWLNDMRNLGGGGGGVGVRGAGLGGGEDGDPQDRPAGGGPGENGDTFVMSFTDVPDSTSYARFQEVIGIAAQFAVSRVTRRFSLFRGLSKESFEKLPLKSLNEINGDICSICYEDFEDDASVWSKRNRSLDGETSVVKRQRVEGNSTPLQNPSRSTPSVQSPEAADAGTNEVSEVSASGPFAPGADAPDTPAPETSNQMDYKHCPTELPCGHIFGRDCIFKWTKEHNSCPICRSRIVEDEGLNHAINDSPVVMDEFDRQSFERIRQLIYGENATNAGNGNGSGGITLQRHNVIVIRPDSAVFNANIQRDDAVPNVPTTESTSDGEVVAPSEHSHSPRANAGDSNNTTAQHTRLSDGMEALGVIPLALFSLGPTANNRNTNEAPTSSVNNNTTDATNAASDTNSNGGGADGAGSLQMNSNDINRLFDLIANLTGRIQSRRTSSSEDTTISLPQELGSLSGSRPEARPGARPEMSTETPPPSNSNTSRFGLFDFLGRGRRIRNYTQNNGQRFLDTMNEGRRGSALGGRNLFSSGVASFRDRTGVRTVDFNGELPQPTSPASILSDPNTNTNNEPSTASNQQRSEETSP
ncbi:ubiquitin-protein ligase SAN1 Ecym_4250 [Eremothecium cymbalariae DBVPG|uniref:RING-type domain-containing protein n=1 Tax=Eremothecium cymbalariae (strain CBS 270.75 / DBVPG 7215 / KCTC 17166 / NRRL Y-17582) TaxID=931890 RepID=G8JTG2_ERECY|nr:hypothetical protein Ecym_4250 [Eremothecium cymbalariae DBVPG\